MSAAKTFEVSLEGAVFALIQVHPGHEESFEQWYGGDHFYSGGVLGPGVLSGGRWFADQPLRHARFIAPECRHPDPYAGNHIAAYWLTAGGLDSFFTWVRPQLHALRAEGRMFEERTHVNVDGYRSVRSDHGPECSVTPVVALDHGFGGLFLSYGEPDGGRPAHDADLPAGSLALTFTPSPGALDNSAVRTAIGTPGLTFPSAGVPVLMTMLFLPEPPPPDHAWARRMTVEIGRASGSTPLWGGGFLPIQQGSRAHLCRMV
jgi:hypothetical protein